MNTIDITIIKLGAGLLLLILANIALGSYGAVLSHEFDREKLVKGLVKGLIVLAALVAVYFAGWLNPDLLVVEAGGETINLMTAIYLLLLAAFTVYALDVLKKLRQILATPVPDSGSYFGEDEALEDAAGEDNGRESEAEIEDDQPPDTGGDDVPATE